MAIAIFLVAALITIVTAAEEPITEEKITLMPKFFLNRISKMLEE